MRKTSLPAVPPGSGATETWLDPLGAAAVLGVTVATLATWRHLGKRGPAFSRPTPRVIRYRRSVLELYLTDAEVQSTTEADARDRAMGGNAHVEV